MLNGKFEVGDRIKATNNQAETGYCITINGWEGIVTEAEGEDGYFEAKDEKSEDSPFRLESIYFKIVPTVSKPIINKPFNRPKGMKNLAAAAKALKRTGPSKEYKVIIWGKLAIAAHDEQEAKEEVSKLIDQGLKIQSMNNLQIDNPQLV